MVEATRQQGISVLLVTRRFWPHTNDGTGRLAMLAEGLRRGGQYPTIMAARYAASWPTEFDYREVRVVRPVAAPRGEWSGALYGRGLQRWLREHVAQYDVVYSDNMREEGAAVVEAARVGGVPCVVRCSGTGWNSDCSWANDSRHARRHLQIAMQANAIVAPFASSARQLVAWGADRSLIHRIPEGIPSIARHDEGVIEAARAALADVNTDLRVPRNGRVMLVTVPLTHESNIWTVVDALPKLIETYSNLRVWFVGDGPLREVIHERLRHLAIRDAVSMPGSIGHVDELLKASDIVVVPSEGECLEHRVPSAIGAGLPLVVAELPDIRASLGPAANEVCTFPPHASTALITQVMSILNNYSEASAQAAEIRNTLRRQLPREHSIESHLQLFLQLARSRKQIDNDPASGIQV
jgi:hypothetical protein